MDQEPGSDDELSSPLFGQNSAIRQQQSSRKRIASDAEDSENTTPIDNLRKLASVSQYIRDARTPSSPARGPASSVPSSIGSRLADRTSTSIQNARNLGRPFGRRPGVNTVRGSGGAPTTPHAIRAMEERRRVAMTPSRERRRASGRGLERGSPFDVLRALSQVATVPARLEQMVVEEEEDELASPGSPEQDLPSADESEESDGITKPPRISLSANDMRIEDDDSILQPPEISRLEEEDLTVRSIENARRAETDASILQRGRISDFFGPSGLGDLATQESTVKQPASPSFMADARNLLGRFGAGDETIDIGQFGPERESSPNQNPADRELDLADSTFRLDIPDIEEDEDEEADEVEDPTAPTRSAPLELDDDSGPEDFGSPSASDAGIDIDPNTGAEDVVTGQFLEDVADDEIGEDDIDQGEEDPERRISRQLEGQYGADEAINRTQLRPAIASKQVTAADDTAIISEAENDDGEEVVIPQPTTMRPVQNLGTRTTLPKSTTSRPRAPKPAITSKHGTKVPSLPSGVVKALADSFLPHSGRTSKKTKKDTVAALTQATDWFFEQVAEDLEAYSKHADRDTIEESDVVALMRRQRVLATGAANTQGNRSAGPGSSKATLFSLAQRFLPRELMTELRMEPPLDERRKKRRRISEGGEFD